MTKRTLRFYTTQGVVPRPLGSPKFARYGYDHLLSLLASRALQDQGLKLEQIKHELSDLSRGQVSRIESVVEDWLTRNEMPELSDSVREAIEAYEPKHESSIGGAMTRTLQLTPHSMLVMGANQPIQQELSAIMSALEILVKRAAR
ncbi:MAG: MerR family transcriptional regulator [Chthonomonas sp.]|nr:MerR family transcriptional regulator [Chthonomonas sp.]